MRTTPDVPTGAVLEHGAEGIALPRGELTIGRDHGSFLRIDDPGVSRAHLKLRVGRGVTVEDLGSTNGTLLNGKSLVGTAKLVDGDMLTIGSRTFVMRFGPRVGFEGDEPTPVTGPPALSREPRGHGAPDGPHLEHTCPKCGPMPLELPVCPGCGYEWPRGPASSKTAPDHPTVDGIRRDERHEVLISVRYSSRRMETTGTVHELSQSGAFVATAAVDRIGTRCRLVLHTRDGDCAELEGFVRRVIHKGVAGVSGMGIEFVRLSEVNARWIREQQLRACLDEP